MRRILKAALAGAAVMVIPLTVLQVIRLGFVDLDVLASDPWLAVRMILGPVVLIVPAILIAMLVVGSPINLAIRRTRLATRAVYAALGATVGAVLFTTPFVLEGDYEGVWAVVLCAGAGAMSGHVWWTGRKAIG